MTLPSGHTVDRSTLDKYDQLFCPKIYPGIILFSNSWQIWSIILSPKYFLGLFCTSTPWLSGATTILHLGEGHREILTLGNYFAKDLNQSSTQASSQGRWKIMLAIKKVCILLQMNTYWRSPLQIKSLLNLGPYFYQKSPFHFGCSVLPAQYTYQFRENPRGE